MAKKRKAECYLNYTGSKRQYLPEIISVIGDYADQELSVLDLFCGGASLSTSLPLAWKVVANDVEKRIIDLHTYMTLCTPSVVTAWCRKHVSSNKDEAGYTKLKEYYNTVDKSPLALYALICSSNTNRVRWNSDGEFNLRFGKRYHNKEMEKHLQMWWDRSRQRDITFTSEHFTKVDHLAHDIVILDPPYSYNGKSTAVYNENGGWQYLDFINTLAICDKLNRAGKKFILFNEMITKGEPNQKLIDWSHDYKVVYLDSDINNSSANRTNKKSVEVMIHNF